MGNCVFKRFGFGEVDQEEENNKMMIKVVTSNGGIMELQAPITAHSITNEFPGHTIYRSRDILSQPLHHNDELRAGESYYLLPLLNHPISKRGRDEKEEEEEEEKSEVNNITASNSSRSSNLPQATPYRMSFDNQRMPKRSSQAEVFPTYNSAGVWKVKLLISPEQLSEILSHEARTEALIESVRTVAKCGSGAASMTTDHSDKWSYSSTNDNWKGSHP